KLDCLTFDEYRFKRLNTETVQGRCTVEHHRMLTDDLIKNVPNLGTLFFDHLLRRLDSVDETALFQLVVDERLEQLECHLLRKTALMQLQSRTNHDDRTARVVHALAQKVLA